MTKSGDVVKGVVKKSAPPSRNNTDPSDPWSATGAGGGIQIPENVTSRRAELLAKFYKSKGYNINYVNKNQRVGQSKTGEFEKWKRDRGIYEDGEVNEDNINDPQSATQSPFDGANTPNDVASPKKTRAAKIVKEIYAKHKLKENLYDHEKDSKGPGTNVKPPKVIKNIEVNDNDEKGTNARMILKGGTTMTGEKRDTIEIDPMMKNRKNSPDYIATNTGKKSNQ
jgi:hypothetical protein